MRPITGEYEGNVWGGVRIVLENDNSLTAKAYLWKSTAPDQSAGPVILDQEFAKSIELDTEYTVSMELSDRVRKTLMDSGIVRIGDLVEKMEAGDQELLALGGFGPKALEEVKERLQVIGLIPDEG